MNWPYFIGEKPEVQRREEVENNKPALKKIFFDLRFLTK